MLAGELTIVEAARREKVSQQSIGRWKAEFSRGRQDRAGDRPQRADLTRGTARG
nr:hypothetical protein [uncultured Aeromicrobium sp.]